jgi:hypothetical protein
MQKQIDILTDLVNKSGLKPSQKKLAFNLIGEMVGEYNSIEQKYQQRIRANYDIRKDFIDYFDRAKTMLYILGVSDFELYKFQFRFTNWIMEHINESAKEISFNSIIIIEDYLKFYEACYDGSLPKSMNELKRFIMEPLKITEETFELEYDKALREFGITKKPNEILKLGWFKKVHGRVEKCQ